MKMLKSFVLSCALLISCLCSLAQNTAEKNIFVIDIKEEIAPPVWIKIKKGMEEAHAIKADVILFHMNTYGGLVDVADSIRTKILNSEIPTAVFIDNNAASAGAFISIACDSIYMRSSGAIGAATVVNETGQAMPDKYQSYMRTQMRATAEANGRNPKIAEAMVDERIEIEGITEAGKLITFTSKEAMKHGFCNAEATSIDDVIKNHLGVEEYQISRTTITWVDKVLGFLVHPMVASLLITMIFGGIYFELQSPGVGFPILAAITGAVLYFMPHYLQGLADNWEIAAFVVGVVLLALEVLVIPGFGVAGIGGLALIILSLVLSMLQNDWFDFSYTPNNEIAMALVKVIVPMMLFFAALLIFGSKIFNSKAFNRIALSDVQSKADGYVIAQDNSALIGVKGQARTTLRPSGKVIIKGTVYEAKAQFGWIDEGKEIKVIGQERFELIVDEVAS